MRTCLLFSCIALCMSLSAYALDVQVAHELIDMTVNKKISLQLTLAHDERGIYKHACSFSIDNPNIKLLSWHATTPSERVYSPAFKKTKKMFVGSCMINVMSDVPGDLQEQYRTLFADTNVHFAGLIAYNDGKVRPFNIVLPLNHDKHEIKTTSSYKKPDQISDNNNKQPEFLPTPDFEKEMVFITMLGDLWARLIAWIECHISWWLLIKLYFVLLFIWLLLIAKHRYRWVRYIMPLSGAWEKEIGRLLIFSFIGIGLYALNHFLPTYRILYLLAMLCFCMMCYAYVFPKKETSFLERLKGLIGFGLGVMVLPLLVKAYLLYCGL